MSTIVLSGAPTLSLTRYLVPPTPKTPPHRVSTHPVPFSFPPLCSLLVYGRHNHTILSHHYSTCTVATTRSQEPGTCSLSAVTIVALYRNNPQWIYKCPECNIISMLTTSADMLICPRCDTAYSGHGKQRTACKRKSPDASFN